MRRRDLITLLGGAVAAWPLAARAQQVIPRTIGVLGSATPASQGERYAVFAERLRALGWIEKRNVTFEYRWAHGRTEAYSEIAAEFVRLKVDVIVTSGTAAVAAAKQKTSAIPIVFTTAGDPVGTGLVASLARPGGNVTGLSLQQTDLAAKRLELLREVVRGLRRVGVLGPNSPDLWRRAADLVDKILRGTKPADIPVEQPTKFDLVINLKTAKGLGLEIPPTLLARADEVIE